MSRKRRTYKQILLEALTDDDGKGSGPRVLAFFFGLSAIALAFAAIALEAYGRKSPSAAALVAALVTGATGLILSSQYKSVKKPQNLTPDSTKKGDPGE